MHEIVAKIQRTASEILAEPFWLPKCTLEWGADWGAGPVAVPLNALELTSTYASTEHTNLADRQTSLVATDEASVATDLSHNESQQKTLLSVMAAIGKTNLFDYLQ